MPYDPYVSREKAIAFAIDFLRTASDATSDDVVVVADQFLAFLNGNNGYPVPADYPMGSVNATNPGHYIH